MCWNFYICWEWVALVADVSLFTYMFMYFGRYLYSLLVVRAASVMSYLVVPFLLGAVSDYMIHVSITLYQGAAFVSFEKKEKKKLKLKFPHVFFLSVKYGLTWSKSKTPLVCGQRPV